MRHALKDVKINPKTNMLYVIEMKRRRKGQWAEAPKSHFEERAMMIFFNH